MKNYGLINVDENVINDGYVQDDYETILSYKIWLALNKISLTKPKFLKETLNVKELSTFKELKEFVQICEEQGLDNLEIDHESDEYSLEYFYIHCNRNTHEKKSDSELKSEYHAYAATVHNRNKHTWEKHLHKIESDKREFALYISLKEKYEGNK